MEPFTKFVITNVFSAVVRKSQLDTEVVLNVGWNNVVLDYDRWTEFKKAYLAIDVEIQKRFKYQYMETRHPEEEDKEFATGGASRV